ncbi:YTH domain-containing protein [Cephalotus follicularis]|uniref:YTH domain-containing family protein n=1 Tax=Cephalotus follicularis TaxID=3775 RepID=A0A1Q3DGY1_CEPFO|nr:YTH domain-containing protein [Cephalotus follicularis]
MDSKERIADPNKLKDQNAVTVGSLRGDTDQLGSFRPAGDNNAAYSPNVHTYRGHSVNHGAGYENAAGKQGMYHPYINADGLGNGSQGMYNVPPPLAFYGHGCVPQMPHRPYAPVITQIPSVRDHAQYNARQFSTLGAPYCQLPSTPNMPFIDSPTLASQEKLQINFDLQGDGGFGLRPDYPTPLGSSGRGSNLSGNSHERSFSHQGFERFGVDGLWLDWLKPFKEKNSLHQISSQAASLKPFRSLEMSVSNIGMASPQKESCFKFGSCSGSTYRGYPYSWHDRCSGYENISTSGLGMNCQNWPTLNEARQRRRCNDFSCSCNVMLDIISERNRGPRAFKPKTQITANGSNAKSSSNGIIYDSRNEFFNRLDFVTSYKDARFFVIKSYSEDNIHRSIKYGLWASTPNGNKKLDAAYREAKEREGACPIFLLFSVNASAQFCGVAEMVGPVDFDKSVDYWLQDKWSGQFPVKWHILKDVPNSQFRHILLENNDKKPVTNSRDTQEVELGQGIQILNIFKNYIIFSSILDDFYFYEERQQAMKERKAKQQESQVATPADVLSEQPNPISLSSDVIKKISKSFAQAVLLNESGKTSLLLLPLGDVGVKPERKKL